MPAPSSAFHVTTVSRLLLAPGLACGCAAAAKLAALHQKTGKRPNILWPGVDDRGFGDIGGIWDGGTIIDRLAQFKQLAACTVGHVVAAFNEAGICPGPMPPCHDGIQI